MSVLLQLTSLLYSATVAVLEDYFRNFRQVSQADIKKQIILNLKEVPTVKNEEPMNKPEMQTRAKESPVAKK
jgi:hypothetical protein